MEPLKRFPFAFRDADGNVAHAVAVRGGVDDEFTFVCILVPAQQVLLAEIRRSGVEDRLKFGKKLLQRIDSVARDS